MLRAGDSSDLDPAGQPPSSSTGILDRLRARVFYGWWMVASGFGIQFLISGLFNQAYGAYVVVLRDDLGWSKTALSGGFSLARFENGLLGPVEGWLCDRLGPRTVIRIGLTVFAFGMMLLSQVHSLMAFYFALFLMALGSSLGGFLPLNVAVVNWFRRRRASAMAIMSTGFSVGGLAVPLVAFCLVEYGWRSTAFGSGVLILFVGLPLSQVVRHRPEQYGEVIDGVRYGSRAAGDDGRPSAVIDDGEDFTARQALRTRAFWFVSLGHSMALLVVSAVSVHLIAHLNENLGYSLGTAALVVALLTGVQTLGQLAGGYLGDRFSKRLIVTCAMAMHMIGLLLVAYATNFAMVIAFAVVHGLAWGMRGPLMSAIRADYFGRTSFGLILGFSSMVTMFGSILGPLVAGILADRTGSYETGFTVLALLAGAGSVFFLLAKRPQHPGVAA